MHSDISVTDLSFNWIIEAFSAHQILQSLLNVIYREYKINNRTNLLTTRVSPLNHYFQIDHLHNFPRFL